MLHSLVVVFVRLTGTVPQKSTHNIALARHRPATSIADISDIRRAAPFKLVSRKLATADECECLFGPRPKCGSRSGPEVRFEEMGGTEHTALSSISSNRISGPWPRRD